MSQPRATNGHYLPRPTPACRVCATLDGYHPARCVSPVRAHGLCSTCYQRIRRRMAARGLPFADALARDDGRREPTYRPRPRRVPVALTYAPRRFVERWEDVG